MNKDERFVAATLKILNEATLSLKGSELHAYVEVLKWLKELNGRLNPPVVLEEKKPKGLTKPKAIE